MKFKNLKTHGFVYALVCQDTKRCYVGSTIQTTNIRHSKHKTDYIGHYQLKPNVVKRHYNTSFEIIKNGNYSVITLEKYNYRGNQTNREKARQLRFREQLYIDAAKLEGLDIVNGHICACRESEMHVIDYSSIDVTPLMRPA